MGIVDDVIFDYFELLTRIPMDEIESMKESVARGENPMFFKKRLAREIVTFYHGEDAAKSAEENFSKTFSNKEIPTDMDVLTVAERSEIPDGLIRFDIVKSKSEFRRLLEAKAITHLETGEKMLELEDFAESGSYRIGAHRFIQIVVSS